MSRAAADQRRGRAGRTEPGVCYRLWDEAETRAPAALRPAGDPGEPTCRAWRWTWPAGARGTRESLAFLDPPPAAGLGRGAGRCCAGSERWTRQGALTAHGRALADLPLPPRLAHMVLAGAASGQGERAARIAALLTERGLGGRDVDLRTRLERLRARRLAARPGRQGARRPLGRDRGRRAGRGTGAPLDRRACCWPRPIPSASPRRGASPASSSSPAAAAWPWIRPTPWPASPGWRWPSWAAARRATASCSAAAVDEAALLDAFADRLEAEERLEPDARRPRARAPPQAPGPAGGRGAADRGRPDPALIASALRAEVARRGLGALPWGERSARLARAPGLPARPGRRLARPLRRGAAGAPGRLAGRRCCRAAALAAVDRRRRALRRPAAA